MRKPVLAVLFSTVSDTSDRRIHPATLRRTYPRSGPFISLTTRCHRCSHSMGDMHQLVPLAQAAALRDKLVADGNSCELMIVPHGSAYNFGRDRPNGKTDHAVW